MFAKTIQEGLTCSTKDDSDMSFSHEGLDAKVKSTKLSIFVSEDHSLLQLANLIDWEEVAEIALPNLKTTTQKGFWNRGRTLYLRIHLSVLFLQVLFKYKDREVERLVSQTPLYQVFCGIKIVKKWKCPDHTKIEDFRNRLSPETQKKLNDYILQLASNIGYADPSQVDIDSTVQEANMAYPSDASLMKKLAIKCKKTLDYMIEKSKRYLPKNLSIDIKSIIKKSREYFFLAKNTEVERKRELFSEYHALVKKELKDFIKFAENLSPQALSHLPWNYQVNIREIKELAWRYILDVAHFVRNDTIKRGKILSFKLKDVICVKKNKPGKDKEFGRVFQLGRIKGNFLVVYLCTNLEMNDKEVFRDLLQEHEEIFGEEVLESITTDKGYYSRKNIRYVEENTGSPSVGLQRLVNIKDQVEDHQQKEILYNRRSGVEPVIGHAKKFGLGRSRMKTDEATLASGYRSVLGFNLHQLVKKLEIS